VSERIRTTTPQQVPDEIERSAALIELLLADSSLRAGFRADPAPILRAHGLGRLAEGLGSGPKALMTLELRESRSSLAGAMVAAAAEGVDVAHVAEHLAPALGHDAGHAIGRLIRSFSHHTVKRPPAHAAPAHPTATLAREAKIPPLAPRPAPPVAPGAEPAAAVEPAVATAPAAAGGTDAPAPSPVEQQPQVAASYGSQHAAAAPSQTAAAPSPANTPAPAEGSGQPAEPAGGAAPVDPTHAQGSGAPATVEPPDTQGTPVTYPGNDATSQQLAAWMGAQAQQAGLPPELPVMAALTESGLRNVPYGTDDSVGFFQMRLGEWDNGPYAGYLANPELQLQWFIQHALAAREQDPALAQSPSSWGEWIANIEQPAAPYRGRYQLQLDAAQQLLAGANLTPVAPAPPETVGEQALSVAMRYIGTPYQWGGSSPATGFDCSGLVQYSFEQEGIRLPRVAAEQFDIGVPVSRKDLQPGDAVFFADPNGYVHHVGLYIGDGKFIDAPETGEDVRIDSLSEPYFAEQFAGARRYTAAALGNPASYARTLPAVGSGS
jgi:cell wall-associated NlpC family hydrolase